MPEGREFRARVEKAANGPTQIGTGANGEPIVDVHDDGPLARLRRAAHAESDSDSSNNGEGHALPGTPAP